MADKHGTGITEQREHPIHGQTTVDKEITKTASNFCWWVIFACRTQYSDTVGHPASKNMYNLSQKVLYEIKWAKKATWVLVDTDSHEKGPLTWLWWYL